MRLGCTPHRAVHAFRESSAIGWALALLITAASLCVATDPAWSEILYSVDVSTDYLVSIDATTGSVTNLLHLDQDLTDVDLAMSCDGQTLYALSSTIDTRIDIYTIHLNDLTFTSRPVHLGSDYPNVGIEIAAEGLAYTDGRLVIGFELRPPPGSYYPSNFSSLSNSLGYLDPDTGQILSSPAPPFDLFSVATQPCPAEDISGADPACRADVDGITALPDGRFLVVDNINDGRFNPPPRGEFIIVSLPPSPAYTLLRTVTPPYSPAGFNDVELSCKGDTFYSIDFKGHLYTHSLADGSILADQLVPLSLFGLARGRPGSIQGPDVVCVGSTHEYSLSGAPDGASVTWAISGDGTFAQPPSGTSVTVLTGLAGSFTLSATVGGGCHCSVEKVVTASATALQVSFDRPRACPDSTATLTVSASQGTPPFRYLWSNGATTQSITVSPGFYTVDVTDAGGCTGHGRGTVGTWVLPGPGISGDLAVCANTSAIQFTSSVPPTGAQSYQWFVNGNGTLVSGQGTETITVDAGAPGSISIDMVVVVGVAAGQGCRQHSHVDVQVTPGSGSVSGFVMANCPAAGTRLQGVTVDAFRVGSGILAGSAVTDPSGYYTIAPLPPGDYVISMITPLNYAAASPEANVTLACSQAANASFDLTCRAIAFLPRTIGYWMHQVSVATGSPGTAQVAPATLCSYLDLIQGHFNANSINQVVVYLPPPSGLCKDKLAALKALLNLTGSARMIDRARQQLIALLLNVASGYASLTQVISADGATLSQAITYCDNLVDNPAGDYEKAKTIADDINNGISVPAGLIPLSTAKIAYAPKAGRPSLHVSPNPGRGEWTFQFAMAARGTVTLRVYDLAGRSIATLLQGDLSQGLQTVRWDGRADGGNQVANGLYLVRLSTPVGSETIKLLQLRP